MFKMSFRGQVLTGFAVSIILVLIVGVLSIISINQLEDDTIMVEHSQQIVKSSNNLLELLIDAETGMRGYAATGNKVFLDPYNTAVPNITVDLNDLRALTANDPLQEKKVEKMSALVNKQLTLLQTNIDA